jgi:hypothetical protein
MEKVAGGDHEFVDVTGRYRATTLKAQLDARRRKDRRQAAAVPPPRTAARRVLRKLTGG